MSSRSLVICDQEEKYAAAFAAFLMKKKELAFQVQVCNSLMQVWAIQQDTSIDIMLIGGRFSREERSKIQAGTVFVLAESEQTEVGPNEVKVYKYQSGESILAEVIDRCSEENETGEFFLRTVKTRRTKIIGIFSPVHRIGKTSYCLELGKEMAISENVLYLNLELYGGIGGYFPEEEKTLADVLYYSRQESKNLGFMLTTLVQHLGALDYLLPVRVSEDIKAVSLEEWCDLLRQITEQSIYDVIILDIDEGIREVYGLLRICTEIYIPVPKTEDVQAKAKLQQFEEELHLLGYDDVRRKMVKKELKR